MIENQNTRVEMKMESFGSKLSSGIVLCSKGLFLRVLGDLKLCVMLQYTCIIIWKRLEYLRRPEAQDVELWLCYLILKKSENMVSRHNTSIT